MMKSNLALVFLLCLLGSPVWAQGFSEPVPEGIRLLIVIDPSLTENNFRVEEDRGGRIRTSVYSALVGSHVKEKSYGVYGLVPHYQSKRYPSAVFKDALHIGYGHLIFANSMYRSLECDETRYPCLRLRHIGLWPSDAREVYRLVRDNGMGVTRVVVRKGSVNQN